ncbi:MAG: HAD family hydrolase [Bacillota bacterium]
MPTPRAILFDLDGTLADTFPLIVASWNAAVGPVTGRTYTASEVISRFGVPDSAMICRELPEHAQAQAVEVYHTFYEANHGMVEVFAGVPELLASLRKLHLPLGLMTGKGRRAAAITLRMLGWDTLFGSVVTGDETPKQKPAPDGLFMVSEQLGVSPKDCIWIGDSPSDMKAGKAAGMFTIAAGWHEVYKGRIAPLNPDFIAQSPSDLASLLTQSTCNGDLG